MFRLRLSTQECSLLQRCLSLNRTSCLPSSVITTSAGPRCDQQPGLPQPGQHHYHYHYHYIYTLLDTTIIDKEKVSSGPTPAGVGSASQCIYYDVCLQACKYVYGLEK
jgi:hypothetical protein